MVHNSVIIVMLILELL